MQCLQKRLLAVTPSTVLDAHIGYTRNVLLVQLTGDLVMNGFLCKIKNWMLLIHSATLEIRSVLGAVAI